MKIWITRGSTGELHSRGLERCFVWFDKPIYSFFHMSDEEINDSPFPINLKRGMGKLGWINNPYSRGCHGKVSFGDLFGYGAEHEGEALHLNHIPGLSEYVWDKLEEHYGKTKFPIGWHEYEKEGKCRQEDFLLEIELNITINKFNT